MLCSDCVWYVFATRWAPCRGAWVMTSWNVPMSHDGVMSQAHVRLQPAERLTACHAHSGRVLDALLALADSVEQEAP
jgi:hypothetical protein